MYDCYMINYEYHKINGITLHETSTKINEMVNKGDKGKQTAEVIGRLTYDIYIQPFTDKPPTDNCIKSRKQMMKCIETLFQQVNTVNNRAKHLLDQLIDSDEQKSNGTPTNILHEYMLQISRNETKILGLVYCNAEQHLITMILILF